MQSLVSNLESATGITPRRQHRRRRVLLRFPARTPATGYRASIDVEGELSGLPMTGAGRIAAAPSSGSTRRRGRTAVPGRAEGRGLHVPATTPGSARPHPARRHHAGRGPLAAGLDPDRPHQHSVGQLLRRDAAQGSRSPLRCRGSTSAGAAVVRSEIAQKFGLHPRLNDGSGLSRYDRTTPFDVVSLLRQQASDPPFTTRWPSPDGRERWSTRCAAPTPRGAAG